MSIKKASKRRSTVVNAPRRAQKAMSREARSLYAEIRQGIRHLETSIGEIQRGLRKAEHKLEADARARIRELRKDARTTPLSASCARRSYRIKSSAIHRDPETQAIHGYHIQGREGGSH